MQKLHLFLYIGFCISLPSFVTADLCPDVALSINGTEVNWSDIVSKGIRTYPGNPSYLRPDRQALLPWIYTVLVLLVHFPIVVIRVVKWQKAQIWSIACSLLTVTIYIQAYISTKFEPGKILVWTPVMLVIDAGSQAQIFFLIAEGEQLFPRLLLECKAVLARMRHAVRRKEDHSGTVLLCTHHSQRLC